jgi:hypothetical protein
MRAEKYGQANIAKRVDLKSKYNVILIIKFNMLFQHISVPNVCQARVKGIGPDSKSYG